MFTHFYMFIFFTLYWTLYCTDADQLSRVTSNCQCQKRFISSGGPITGTRTLTPHRPDSWYQSNCHLAVGTGKSIALANVQCICGGIMLF